MHRRTSLAVVPLLPLLLAAACGDPAARPATGPSCLGGLYWRDAHWVEHDVGRFATGPELTDEGQFPGCRSLDPEGGFATDVYRIRGVPTPLAIAGHRHDSDRYVVYVREGADPHQVARLLSRQP